MYQPKLSYLTPHRQIKYKPYGQSQTRTSLRYQQEYYPQTDRSRLTDPISIMLPSNTQSTDLNIRVKFKGDQPDILKRMEIPTYKTPWSAQQQNYQKRKQLSAKQAFNYERPMSYKKYSVYDNCESDRKYGLTNRSNSIRKHQKSRQQIYHSSYLNQRLAQIKNIYRQQPSSYSIINNINQSNTITSSPSKYNSYNPSKYIPSSTYSQLLNRYSPHFTSIQNDQIPYIGLKSSRNNQQIPKEAQPKTTSRIGQYISTKVQQHKQSLPYNSLQTRQSIKEDYLPQKSQISVLEQNNNNTIKQQSQELYVSSKQIIQSPPQQNVILQSTIEITSHVQQQQNKNKKFNYFREVESIISSVNPSQIKGSEVQYVIKAHEPIPIISQIKQSLQIKEMSNDDELFNIQNCKQIVSNNPSKIKEQNSSKAMGNEEQRERNNQREEDNRKEMLQIDNDAEIVFQEPEIIKSPTFNNLQQHQMQINFNQHKQQDKKGSPEKMRNSNTLNQIISRTVEPIFPSNPFVNKRTNSIAKEEQKLLFNRPGISALRSQSNKSKSITEMRQCSIGKNILRTKGITITKLQKSVQYVDVPEMIAKNWSQMQL